MTISGDLAAALVTIFIGGLISLLVWIVKKVFMIEKSIHDLLDEAKGLFTKKMDELDDRLTYVENEDRACRSVRKIATDVTIKELEFKNKEQDVELVKFKEELEAIDGDINKMEDKISTIERKMDKIEATQGNHSKMLEDNKKMLEDVIKLIESALKIKG